MLNYCWWLLYKVTQSNTVVSSADGKILPKTCNYNTWPVGGSRVILEWIYSGVSPLACNYNTWPEGGSRLLIEWICSGVSPEAVVCCFFSSFDTKNSITFLWKQCSHTLLTLLLRIANYISTNNLICFASFWRPHCQFEH